MKTPILNHQIFRSLPNYPFIYRKSRNGSTVLRLSHLIGIFILLFAGTSGTAQISTSNYYYLQAVHSGKVVQLARNSNDNGVLINQWDKTGATTQQFKFVPKEDGYYNIVVRSSGKLLDVSQVSQSDGAVFHQWEYWNGDNQKFKLEPAGNGVYFIRARHSGKYLDVSRVSRENGAVLHQWSRTGAGNQQFRLLPVVENTPQNDNLLTAEQQAMLEKCVGKGYRAEKGYADLNYATRPLFVPQELARYASVQETGKFEGRMAQGRSIRQYSNSLSAAASIEGSYGLFSAGISTSFSSSSTQRSDNSFFTWNRVIGYYRLDIDPDRTALLPEVKNDINYMAPNDLFDKYGTHFIQSAFIGARIAFNTYINRSEFTDESDFEASVKASYGTVSGEGSVGTANKTYQDEFTKNASVQVFGGDPALAEAIERDKNNSQFYTNWRNTIRQQMTLADFGDHGLQPIAELAATDVRRNELKTAMKKYLEDHGTPLPEPAPVIRQNSTFVLKSNDGRYLTRPIFKPFPQAYYPIMYVAENIGDFRVAGRFTFNPYSPANLVQNNNVTIMFQEDELMPHWTEGNRDKEQNADWIKKRFLKLGGIIPFAHFWDHDAWAQWTIQKVGAQNGATIYSGDEVYIYHIGTKKYLTTLESGAIGVEESKQIPTGMRDDKFIWKIIVKDSGSETVAR
ncbi:RICIN domain-containing protein [Flavilitoribacter nigricans]|uniref:MACPF domain-containing protein n=1 Tax=Flavilitoribacter nigricans (strain ATCC 23147 / DSM 23189 / NBRC 102662 / NCIMB 1420 / SS-2) TaxID=1122177 RepID=A0A2D0N4M0_FLAN2|nr:RICIN domain-containing protein [Flavilitoribacter nigricans]PHN03377.1 hypothetical protein CRP01_27215 [Flavilitoribacter nigricans DSM 23189 = NBRC 102662]